MESISSPMRVGAAFSHEATNADSVVARDFAQAVELLGNARAVTWSRIAAFIFDEEDRCRRSLRCWGVRDFRRSHDCFVRG